MIGLFRYLALVPVLILPMPFGDADQASGRSGLSAQAQGPAMALSHHVSRAGAEPSVVQHLDDPEARLEYESTWCYSDDPTAIQPLGCPPPVYVVLPQTAAEAVNAEDVARVLASGSGALRQPPGGQVLLSKPLIVYTDPSVRTLTASVGGVDVELSLTPVSYTWDWGDGTSTTTTDPGDVYPNQSVTHYYGQTASGVVVSVTTMWDAVFRPVGAAQWQPVVGQVTTMDEAAPFDIVRRVAVLTDTAEELQGR